MTDSITWTQSRRRLGDLSPWPRNPRQIAAAGQLGYNSNKEMPERYANTLRRDDWIRASHKSSITHAPVACQVTGAFSMTARDGKPCRNCGGVDWYGDGKCKACVSERQRRYYRENPEPKKANTKRWKQQNPERKKELDKNWGKRNPDKVKANAKRYIENNREKAMESRRRWRAYNPEKKMAIEHKRRAKQISSGGTYTAAEWRSLIAHYGGKCLCCGRDDVALTVDHVIPISKGGSNSIDNIQPLCLSCNSRKFDKIADYRPTTGLGRWIQRKLFG